MFVELLQINGSTGTTFIDDSMINDHKNSFLISFKFELNVNLIFWLYVIRIQKCWTYEFISFY